ncbi:MAG: single-stranded-DNA-specific exonuclease RecJ [Candidatus Pacebacteria bacterium CG10_big_fil_rev_8_21_14_0_10_56_10]|nr:MAG: single-stranded-DNA-specific exonuclease RecJ [Candidatus Pacebacteria bacterium CG10_big_fil_rev_8_21_14_0_10_56_10]
MRWHLSQPSLPRGPDQVIDLVLANRGVSDRQSFLGPAHPSSLSPARVGIDDDQLRRAVDRLDQARRRRQKVAVFGDYDVDGICAAAVLWQTLYRGGWQVMPFIPHRQRHGYGLTDAALRSVRADHQPDLIVTVDNGIVALEQVKRLVDQGIDVIVTDHHLPEERAGRQLLPPATAVVHTTQLCGTTVAWVLAREVARQLLDESDDQAINDQLDLAGLATIADQVKLHDANRSFAFHGIEALRRTGRPGLTALIAQAGIDQQRISAGQVGFGLAPRINAMGRLDDGLAALRMLCTGDPAQANRQAALLDQTNLDRRNLTKEAIDTALAQADDWQDEHLIVAASPLFHQGVVGLVAGRLVEQFAKPAIVMSVDDKVVKASARSIPGVDIVELVRQVRDDLLDVGGHPMAAGFSLAPAKLEAVTSRLYELARRQISPELLEPAVVIDCRLPPELVGLELVGELERLEPHGSGNPRPTFLLEGWRLDQFSTVGKENSHLKLRLSRGGQRVTGMGWRLARLSGLLTAPGDVPGHPQLDLVVELERNHWNGRTSLQLVVRQFRLDRQRRSS